MSVVMIGGNPTFKKTVPEGKPFINVSEFFCDTVQGENFVGWPAAFLRVQHCSQSCIWCDTKEVWRFGNPYTFEELFDLMDQADLPRKLSAGQHLVLTGGSPVLAQDELIEFIQEFIKKYGFKPYIEIENEATIMPKPELVVLIDLWNNSPKLKSSYNPRNYRFQPEILRKLSSFNNSWFKFVVSCEDDWEEIDKDFIHPGLINKDQIVLMPLGATRVELLENRQVVVDLAVRENVRYSTREHIILWDKKTGV